MFADSYKHFLDSLDSYYVCDMGTYYVAYSPSVQSDIIDLVSNNNLETHILPISIGSMSYDLDLDNMIQRSSTNRRIINTTNVNNNWTIYGSYGYVRRNI